MSRQKPFALLRKEKKNALREPSPMPKSLPQVAPNDGFTWQVLVSDHAEDQPVSILIEADLAILVHETSLEVRHGNNGRCVFIVIQNLPYHTVCNPHVVYLLL